MKDFEDFKLLTVVNLILCQLFLLLPTTKFYDHLYFQLNEICNQLFYRSFIANFCFLITESEKWRISSSNGPILLLISVPPSIFTLLDFT